MRHAKSDWANENLTDFERPLNKRGRNAAKLTGEIMRRENYVPESIVCSNAVRAAQTVELVRAGGAFENVPLQFEPRIYEASVTTLLYLVSKTESRIDSLMIVGHNPGFENLVGILADEFKPMPTAALAIVELSLENWRDIAAGSGKLQNFLRPKDFA